MPRIIDPWVQPEIQVTILFVVAAGLEGLLWYNECSWWSLGIFFAFTLLFAKALAQGGRNKWPNNEPPSIKGRTVIVTGSNSGIGAASTFKLAAWGARIVLACRDLVSAEKVATALRAKYPGTRVEVWKLDLSSLDSVKAFSKNWYDQDTEDTAIHLLLNNAGVMMTPFYRTKDGHEMQFGTNHVGHFLLTTLLVPALRLGAKKLAESPKSGHWTDAIGVRVVNVSSLAHGFVPDNADPAAYWKALLDVPSQDDKTASTAIKYDPYIAYGFSKLANIYYSVRLNKVFAESKSEGARITAYSVHPGAVRTNLIRHFASPLVMVSNVVSHFLFKSAQSGAEPLLYCAFSDAAIPGAYHSNCDSADCTKLASDLKEADQLWDISFSFVKLDQAAANDLFTLPIRDALALASKLSRDQD